MIGSHSSSFKRKSGAPFVINWFATRSAHNLFAINSAAMCCWLERSRAVELPLTQRPCLSVSVMRHPLEPSSYIQTTAGEDEWIAGYPEERPNRVNKIIIVLSEPLSRELFIPWPKEWQAGRQQIPLPQVPIYWRQFTANEEGTWII